MYVETPTGIVESTGEIETTILLDFYGPGCHETLDVALKVSAACDDESLDLSSYKKVTAKIIRTT